MLEGLFGKVMAGLLSVSALMFSSYSGNEPVFRPLQCRAGQSYLLVKSKLDKAFDNDFADVFRCGKAINVWFKVELRQAGNIAFSRTYRHTVTYDPLNAVWELYTSEDSRREIYDSYAKLLAEVSELECSIPRERTWRSVEIRSEAWLPSLDLANPDRTVDLMMLWKFKRPTARQTFSLPPTS